MASTLGKLRDAVTGTAKNVTRVVPEEERVLKNNKIEGANDTTLKWFELDVFESNFIKEGFDVYDSPFLAAAIKTRTEFHRQTWDGALQVTVEHLDSVLKGHGLRRNYAVSPKMLYTWGLGMLQITMNTKIRDRYTVTLWTSNKLACEALIAAIKIWISVAPLPPEAPAVYALTSSSPGYFSMHSMGPMVATLERDNYDPEVIKGIDEVTRQFASAKPPARLAVIEGPPGTGKTNLVMAMVAAFRGQKCVYIPASLLPQLDQPGFLRTLIDNRQQPFVLIVEDGDSSLLDRVKHPEASNNVSTLLNLSDGFLSRSLDIRMIVTCNLGEKHMDEAVTREGRLLAHIKVGKLTADQALAVYRRLCKGNTTDAFVEGETYSLGSVYAMARNKK